MKKPSFETEADLCRAFSTCIPDEWTAYNETGGFDILLVHENGVQIGVEAKLTLNSKVLCQAISGRTHGVSGPDFRAVLVGRVVSENAALARALGVSVIELDAVEKRSVMSQMYRDWQGPKQVSYKLSWRSRLPEFKEREYNPKNHIWMDSEYWYDQAPTHRLALPEYVPDVEAGHPSPHTLSRWKIQAIKVCVHAVRVGKMNRAQFESLKIDPGRWMNGYWMKKSSQRGFWEPAEHFPAETYRAQHPEIYAQIEKDYAGWSVREGLAVPRVESGV